MFVGAISCKSTGATYNDFTPDDEQYERVLKVVDNIESVTNYLRNNVLHVIPASQSNFYLGVKISFMLDYKHNYYPWIKKCVIEELEDLMNALGDDFQEAVLYEAYHDFMIEWHSPEYIRKVQLTGEPSKYPHIHRFARGDIDQLPIILPSERFIM